MVEQATRASERRGDQVTRCHSTRSRAATWSRSRRVVITVAVSNHGVTTRCVVTDLAHARTQVRSQNISCARGQADNETKEHTRSVQSDRPSGHRFAAKQWRLWLHAAASVWLETFRREV